LQDYKIPKRKLPIAKFPGNHRRHYLCCYSSLPLDSWNERLEVVSLGVQKLERFNSIISYIILLDISLIILKLLRPAVNTLVIILRPALVLNSSIFWWDFQYFDRRCIYI